MECFGIIFARTIIIKIKIIIIIIIILIIKCCCSGVAERLHLRQKKSNAGAHKGDNTNHN